MNVVRITPDYAVAGPIGLEDVPGLVARGFKSVVDFRRDGESAGQPASAAVEMALAAHGLGYVHVPAHKFELFTDDVVRPAVAAFASLQGPVLGICATGQRAAIVWAAASARQRPVELVLRDLTAAGFDLAFLRDDLDAQAGRAQWLPQEAASPLAPASVGPKRVAA